MGNACDCVENTAPKTMDVELKPDKSAKFIKDPNPPPTNEKNSLTTNYRITHMKKRLAELKALEERDYAEKHPIEEVKNLSSGEKDQLLAELANILRTQVDNRVVNTSNAHVKRLLVKTTGNTNIGFPYQGEMINGIPNGKGRVLYSPFWTYDGDLLNGQEDGSGTMSFENGEVFVGDFRNGCFNGHGMYKFKDGEVYEGRWRSDKIEGLGMTTCPDGGIYFSTYKEGDLDGPYIELSNDRKRLFLDNYKRNKAGEMKKIYTLVETPTEVQKK